MISVVIPLYDKAGQVSKTLDSIRQQTFSDYEVIIVDDASTDGSPEVVREYLKEHTAFASKVKLLSQEHGGVSIARNRAIRESRREWIAFLDADDRWAADYLETQYALAQKYCYCPVLASGYWIVHDENHISPAKISRLMIQGPNGVLKNYFEVAACSHPPMTTATTIVKKKALEEVGLFPPGIGSGEDLLTWARLAVRYPIAYTRQCIGFYTEDFSAHNEDQRKRRPEKEDVVGRELELLYRQNKNTKGLKEYVGAWYKMRVRIYLSHSMRKEAWREWQKMVGYAPFHYKTWVYGLLLISPVRVPE